MQTTKTYIAKQKREWFKYLKVFYNLTQTHTKLDRSIEQLQSDYGSELRSWKVDKWLINQGIIFEPLKLYFLEENGVSSALIAQ